MAADATHIPAPAFFSQRVGHIGTWGNQNHRQAGRQPFGANQEEKGAKLGLSPQTENKSAWAVCKTFMRLKVDLTVIRKRLFVPLAIKEVNLIGILRRVDDPPIGAMICLTIHVQRVALYYVGVLFRVTLLLVCNEQDNFIIACRSNHATS